MDVSPLRSLGITDAEISVYITLVKKGELLASQISDITKIHRTNVYDILDKLVQKGLIVYSTKNAKKYFKSTAPKHLSFFLEDKLAKLEGLKADVDGLVKQLEQVKSVSKNVQEVEVYLGKNGLKIFYEELAQSVAPTDEFHFISSSGKIFDLLQYYFPQYIRRIMEMNLHGYMLAHPNIMKHSMYFKPSGVEIRFLPDNYEPSTTFLVIGDNLGIYSIHGEDEPFVILIRSNSIARAYLHQFKLLWERLKE